MDVAGDRDARTSYRLDLQYDGSEFAGWQVQPKERTVQGCLEDAVEVLFGERVNVLASGRTDAGVHATGQVAHLRTVKSRDPKAILFGLNDNLPPDIRVQRVDLVSPDFHARYSAKWRGYLYQIASVPTAVGRQYCWQCPFDLDVGAMGLAAKQILGSHCFRAFAHEAEKETHYLSDVYCADWKQEGALISFHVEANRFLHGMVRFLVGTFVAIGRGRLEPGQLVEILKSEDVRRSGQKAPASGLTLVKVGFRSWPQV